MQMPQDGEACRRVQIIKNGSIFNSVANKPNKILPDLNQNTCTQK